MAQIVHQLLGSYGPPVERHRCQRCLQRILGDFYDSPTALPLAKALGPLVGWDRLGFGGGVFFRLSLLSGDVIRLFFF